MHSPLARVGRSAGFATGLGAATAHAFYVAIAIGGLGVSQFVLNGTAFVRPFAGLALVVLGLRTWRAEPPSEGGRLVGDTTGWPAYGSTLALALANPLTVLSLTALVAGMGTSVDGPVAGVLLVTGVFVGSALWWFTLTITVVSLRSRLKAVHMEWVNRATAASVGGFGLVIVAQSLGGGGG